MILIYNQETRDLGVIDALKNGQKIHSFRPDPGKRWRPGMTVHQAERGAKMKYLPIRQDVCISVQEVEVCWWDADYPCMTLWIDGVEMDEEQIALIAKNDGFKTVEDFKKYFSEDWEGRLIHWTYLRY